MTSTTTAQTVLTIGGEPQPGAAASYPVHNPARPAEVVGQAPAADRDQLDAAVTAARRAAAGWRALDVAERVAAVAAAAGSAAEQLAVSDGALLYTREHGKVLAEARFEIDTGPAVVSLLGAIAEAALAPERIDPQSDYPRLQREPYGVAALVLPFNWPLALTMTKLSSALAAGNTAVVKVPPTCPLAALRLGAALAAALPPGVVNILAGPGSELAQALVTHPGIDVISLTGGVATGRAVMAAAAPRLTPVLLELGGNDAAIIAPDITLTDQLVDQLVTATYTTCGQVCMAIKRLYAPADLVGELADAVLARCSREVVGDGLAEEVTLGPMHTAAGRDRVQTLLADAEEHGATVRTAGAIRDADADAGGYFALPTVVTDLAPDTPLATEEQFGPV
ncbi:MAG: aldehyde dehydrogenase family protein, partial [Mycobacterium sp.]